MEKNEIQDLLGRFGFITTVNKNIGGTGMTHVIHVGNSFNDLVEYTVDGLTNLVNRVWLFRDGNVNLAETTLDIEIWLKK